MKKSFFLSLCLLFALMSYAQLEYPKVTGSLIDYGLPVIDYIVVNKQPNWVYHYIMTPDTTLDLSNPSNSHNYVIMDDYRDPQIVRVSVKDCTDPGIIPAQLIPPVFDSYIK